MNVIFISEPLYPIGGTANRTLNLAETLSRRGHKIQIITPSINSNMKLDDVEIIYIKPIMYQKFGIERRNEFIKFIFKNGGTNIVKTIRKIQDRDTIIHYVNYYMSLTRILSKEKIYIPYIYDIQASAYLEANTILEKIITRFIEKTCVINGNIIVPTKELKEYFLRNYNMFNSKIEYIPLAVSPQKNNIDKELLRSDVNVNSEFLAVFHGSPYNSNIEALKRIKIVVEEINKSGNNLKVLILGNVGKFESSEYFIQAGYVNDLDKYISIADMALLPIDSESLGARTRVLDYMKNGIPIIAFEKGLCGFDQAIKEKALISVKNLDEMKKTTEYCISNNSYLKEISEKSRIYLNKYHSYDTVAKKLESYYENILS